MGKKKTLREVLYQHPDLFDLVQLLASGDDILASEDETALGKTITLSREGKPKKKRRNEFTFRIGDDGYLLLRAPTSDSGNAPPAE